MSELPPASSNEQLVRDEIDAAIEEDRVISPTAARVIASLWHSGQASALYSFVSTGAINWLEIESEYHEALHQEDNTEFDIAALRHLAAHLLDAEGVDEYGNRGRLKIGTRQQNGIEFPQTHRANYAVVRINAACRRA